MSTRAPAGMKSRKLTVVFEPWASTPVFTSVASQLSPTFSCWLMTVEPMLTVLTTAEPIEPGKPGVARTQTRMPVETESASETKLTVWKITVETGEWIRVNVAQSRKGSTLSRSVWLSTVSAAGGLENQGDSTSP